ERLRVWATTKCGGTRYATNALSGERTLAASTTRVPSNAQSASGNLWINPHELFQQRLKITTGSARGLLARLSLGRPVILGTSPHPSFPAPQTHAKLWPMRALSLKCLIFCVGLCVLVGSPAPRAPARAEVPVDLELVIAVDVSLSMDLDEQRLQRDGY